MINYFFVLDIKSNRVIFSHPKNRKEMYKVYVDQAVKKIKPADLLISARGKKRYPSEERIMYKKMDENLFLAAIVSNIKLEAEVYKFFFDFYDQLSNFRGIIKNNNKLCQWTKNEVKKLNQPMSVEGNDRQHIDHNNTDISVLCMFNGVNDYESQIGVSWEDSWQSSNKKDTFYTLATQNNKVQVFVWALLGFVTLFMGIIFIESFYS